MTSFLPTSRPDFDIDVVPSGSVIADAAVADGCVGIVIGLSENCMVLEGPKETLLTALRKTVADLEDLDPNGPIPADYRDEDDEDGEGDPIAPGNHPHIEKFIRTDSAHDNYSFSFTYAETVPLRAGALRYWQELAAARPATIDAFRDLDRTRRILTEQGFDPADAATRNAHLAVTRHDGTTVTPEERIVEDITDAWADVVRRAIFGTDGETHDPLNWA